MGVGTGSQASESVFNLGQGFSPWDLVSFCSQVGVLPVFIACTHTNACMYLPTCMCICLQTYTCDYISTHRNMYICGQAVCEPRLSS